MTRIAIFVISISLLVIAAPVLAFGDPSPMRLRVESSDTVSPMPATCAQWVQLTGGLGPTINGVRPVWTCIDEPGGGYRLSTRGIP